MSNLRFTYLSCHSFMQGKRNKSDIEGRRFYVFLKRYTSMNKIKLEIYKEVLNTLLKPKIEETWDRKKCQYKRYFLCL